MSKRVLYVTGEIAPFSEATATATLMRQLAEALAESEDRDYEARVIMPRYGTVSERRNRLHEVIRLSGAVIPAGDKKDTLKVKVASIPGLRLQVYFMDSPVFLKRRGIWEDKKYGRAVQGQPRARALLRPRRALHRREAELGRRGGPRLGLGLGACCPCCSRRKAPAKRSSPSRRSSTRPTTRRRRRSSETPKPSACPPTSKASRSARRAAATPTPSPRRRTCRTGGTDLSGDDAAERTAPRSTKSSPPSRRGGYAPQPVDRPILPQSLAPHRSCRAGLFGTLCGCPPCVPSAAPPRPTH